MKNNGNNETYSVDISGIIYKVAFPNDPGKVIINNETVCFNISPRAIPDHYSLIVDNKSFLLGIEKTDIDKVFRVHAGGYDFDAEVTSSRETFLREFLLAAGVGKSENRIIAPMPGLIVKLNASVGDKIKKGAGILVMEAMKMENEIKAPYEGTIISIEVVPGQIVEKGQFLLEIE